MSTRLRMPAEWEPHDGCWMIWPERPDNWRDGAAPARRAFADVAHAIAATEPLNVVASAAARPSADAMLPRGTRILEADTNDAWARDIAPSFVLDDDTGGNLVGVDWRFNAWGGLYAPSDADDALAARIIEAEGARRIRAPLVLEGGAIHVDGEGTLLTTEQCLLNPNRNPGLSRAEIEQSLASLLGVTAVIWLGEGVFADETDGHVDNLACFAAPGIVLLAGCEDPADPQHAIAADAETRLRHARDASGRALEIVRLPIPGPLFATQAEAAGMEAALETQAGFTPKAMDRSAGHRLAASYVNHYVGNGIVVMPLLDPRTDDEARRILARVYPGRRVVGIASREILLGGGNIHCIVQQVPARQGRARDGA